MGDVAHVLTVVFPVLTIIIGAACALQFSVMTTLRASNADLRERVKELEDKDTRSDVKIAGQNAELAALGKVVTGEVHLVAITDLLEHHHAESVRIWGDVQKTLTHVDKTIDALAKGQP
jgi:hypothetical protein